MQAFQPVPHYETMAKQGKIKIPPTLVVFNISSHARNGYVIFDLCLHAPQGYFGEGGVCATPF